MRAAQVAPVGATACVRFTRTHTYHIVHRVRARWVELHTSLEGRHGLAELAENDELQTALQLVFVRVARARALQLLQLPPRHQQSLCSRTLQPLYALLHILLHAVAFEESLPEAHLRRLVAIVRARVVAPHLMPDHVDRGNGGETLLLYAADTGCHVQRAAAVTASARLLLRVACRHRAGVKAEADRRLTTSRSSALGSTGPAPGAARDAALRVGEVRLRAACRREAPSPSRTRRSRGIGKL